MNESNLKLYSLGIVTKDKLPGDDYIEVCPIEKFSIQESNELGKKEKIDKSSLKDSNNKGFDTEVKHSNVVKAKWISLGVSNRTTAPDVYKSETVLLFKFADVNEYYWTTIFREPNLRRQETVLYSYSNLKSGLEAYDLDTSYYFLVDTRNKKIVLKTSNNDGELTTYNVTIDTKKGSVEIKDGKNNFIQLDSEKDTLTATTNSSVVINTKNFVVNAQSTTINTTNFNLNSSNTNMTGNVVSSGSSAVFNSNVNINGKLVVPVTVTQVEGCCTCC